MKQRLPKAVWLFLLFAFLIPGCAKAPRRVSTPVSFTPPPITTPSGFYHTVQKGQTLYRIAKNYNIDVKELMAANRISNPSSLEVGQRLYVPQQAAPAFAPVTAGPLSVYEIQRRVGSKVVTSDWRTITVHHSGTLQGAASSFDKDHQRRHMGGLFYHFVIGNGSRTGDGALEVGFRWNKQIKANRPYDIQICLVGDFNQQYVSESQFSTLVNLIQVLREEYGIPVGAIRRHEDIKGKHTECPGKHFPFQRLISELTARDAVSRAR